MVENPTPQRSPAFEALLAPHLQTPVIPTAPLDPGRRHRWAAVTNAADLGAFLRSIREEAGLSQEEIAERLDIDRRYVYQIESGTPTLYATRLFALLSQLGIRLEAHQR